MPAALMVTRAGSSALRKRSLALHSPATAASAPPPPVRADALRDASPDRASRSRTPSGMAGRLGIPPLPATKAPSPGLRPPVPMLPSPRPMCFTTSMWPAPCRTKSPFNRLPPPPALRVNSSTARVGNASRSKPESVWPAAPMGAGPRPFSPTHLPGWHERHPP